MKFILPIAWLMIGVCAVPTLWGMFRLVMRYNINDEAFLGVIERMLRARNVSRAHKLIAACHFAMLPIFVKQAIKLNLPRYDEEAIAAGYREQASQRSYAERLHLALEPTRAGLLNKLNLAWGATLLGVIPLPLLWLATDTFHSTRAHYIAAGVLFLLMLLSTRVYFVIRGSFDRAVQILAPLLEQELHHSKDDAAASG